MGIVRKISIGQDYKSGAMHYIVGQSILGGKKKIHEIRVNNSTNLITIYAIEGKEITKWKSFTPNMPIAIEYNMDF
jgi:hypothetical protein